MYFCPGKDVVVAEDTGEDAVVDDEVVRAAFVFTALLLVELPGKPMAMK